MASIDKSGSVKDGLAQSRRSVDTPSSNDNVVDSSINSMGVDKQLLLSSLSAFPQMAEQKINGEISLKSTSDKNEAPTLLQKIKNLCEGRDPNVIVQRILRIRQWLTTTVPSRLSFFSR